MDMTLVQYLNGQFSLLQVLDFFCRLALACVLGALIGIERSKRFKEAGVRTHIIVCCGAALFMIVSKYGFADLSFAGGHILTAPAEPTLPVWRLRWSAVSASSARASFSKMAVRSAG